MKLNIHDTDSREEMKSSRAIGFNDADVFIICFNVNDKKTLQNSYTKWIEEVKLLAPNKNAPVILCGLKIDLEKKIR
jgi:GTPase SAR1 family protein